MLIAAFPEGKLQLHAANPGGFDSGSGTAEDPWVITTAMDAARSISIHFQKTQVEVNTAFDDLQRAHDMFLPKCNIVDDTALDAKIAEATGLKRVA